MSLDFLKQNIRRNKMAEINLLNIKPHQVSRDMRGYSVFFYGDPKSGNKIPETSPLSF